MKKLIIKYSIEFFVIVFSISVSFFGENLREENEKDNLRILVKQSLLEELILGNDFLKFRDIAFNSDLKAIELIVNEGTPIDSIFSNVSPAGFSNPFMVARNFNPPSSVYNSLINDGNLNFIKSQDLKELIEETYVFYTELIQGWADGEQQIANKIKIYIMENYPEFYLKDIYTTTDFRIMSEFHKMVQKDIKLKAYLKAKTEPMMVKQSAFEQYKKSRNELIYALEESLK